MGYLSEAQQSSREIVPAPGRSLSAGADMVGAGVGAEASEVEVPLDLLHATHSPRLSGENPDHVQRIAELDNPMPPIVVHRRTMRVIDGMHRIRAARLRGRTTISVVFFDGSEVEAFALAVKLNTSHGLPLTRVERLAAAERILLGQPQLSDRAIGACAGLAAKTVAAIRERVTDTTGELGVRIGRDGKARPVDGTCGRLLASEFIKSSPQASLREIARVAGVSPATVRDVRDRLENGKDPVPQRNRKKPRPILDKLPEKSSGPSELLDRLRRDPSIRQTEPGRALLRLLSLHAVGAAERQQIMNNLPEHSREILAQLAREYAANLQQFASELATG